MVKKGKICGQKSKICDFKEAQKRLYIKERWFYFALKHKITLPLSRINCKSLFEMDFEKYFEQKRMREIFEKFG